MKRIFLLFAGLLFLVSCNSITAGHYLLTDENANYLEPKYEYWYSEQMAEDTDEFPIRLIGFNSAKKRKMWIFEPYPNSKKENPGYLRKLDLKNGKQLFQLTTWEKEKIILFFYGKRLNDSTFVFYALNSDAIRNAEKSELLKPLKTGVQFKRDELHFDSITTVNNTARVLEFLKNEMSRDFYFEKDSLVLKGTNNPTIFKKERE